MSDADEAAREHVLEETVDEGWRFEREELLDAAALSIAIAKGYLRVVAGHQSLIPDGDAMGIAAQVPKHLRGTRHGSLAVDHPLLGCRLSYQPMPTWVADARASGVKGPLEAVEKLASKDPRKDSHGHQEAGPTSDPPVPRRREASAGHDAMDVRMEGESLRPGVQDGDGARQGSQPTPADVVKRFERRLK